MITKYLFKDTFAVIGKAGQGAANNPQAWIFPLWDEANAHFSEVAALAKKSEDGTPQIWGAMNDTAESNKRWNDESGKYMAGCETDVATEPPDGWTKWIIPAQTYLVVETTMDKYGEVFGKITTDPQIQIVSTAHERYPQPGNPNVVDLWFPIAVGMIFCQSCAMPLAKTEDFGKETDGNINHDYCCHCYEGGSLGGDMTMEEMIEICIPFCRDQYESDEAARTHMMSFFPKLKRCVFVNKKVQRLALKKCSTSTNTIIAKNLLFNKFIQRAPSAAFSDAICCTFKCQALYFQNANRCSFHCHALYFPLP